MKKLILLLLGIFVFVNSYSQWWIPDEEYGDGQYWETDAINYQDYPYTTFKRYDNITIPQQLQNIRDLIIDGIPDCDSCSNKNEFQSLYKDLWIYATGPRPSTQQQDDNNVWVSNEKVKKTNQLSGWAKALAFIYLIGIDPDGNTLTSTQLENFGWNAEKALRDMNTDVEWWEYDKLLGRSRELLQAVQAYDLLKASGRLKDDRNHSDLTPRDNIRKFARDIFNEANDKYGILQNPFGYKKNHGISTAASLGITRYSTC